MKQNFKCLRCSMGSRHETMPGPALNQKFIITQDAICLALTCL